MSQDHLQFIFDKSLGVIGLSLLGFLANSWVKALETKFEHMSLTLENRTKSIEDRMNMIEGKYRDVLDIVLAKFSAWEDRIANLLLKVKDSSPEQLKDEVDKFKSEAKNDIMIMKLEVERVRVDVKKIIEVPTTPADVSASLIQRFMDFEQQFIDRIESSEKRVSMILKMVGHLNNTTKTHEFKINNLVATRVGSNDSGNR